LDRDVVVPSTPGLHLLLDDPASRGLEIAPRLAVDRIDAGEPVLAVLLDEATPQFRSQLTQLGADTDTAEKTGNLLYVDAHAPQVGWAHTNPATVFAETEDPDALLLAVSEAQSTIVERAPQHTLIVESLSSLLVTQGLNAAYRFGQNLASMAPRMGAVALARVVPGMHDEQETTALRHLATTVTDLTDTATREESARARSDDTWPER
jgi:KaiC/GvpD/RAD55 family RecA-like ATPase